MNGEPSFYAAYKKACMEQAHAAHLNDACDLAAAFLVRYGIDPEDAEVVTVVDEETMTWRSHIERKRRGVTTA